MMINCEIKAGKRKKTTNKLIFAFIMLLRKNDTTIFKTLSSNNPLKLFQFKSENQRLEIRFSLHIVIQTSN